MIKEAILKVVNGNDLNAKEAYGAMDEIMSGEASECLFNCTVNER